MDKTDSFDKMDALVNGKQSYEELKRDPTPAPWGYNAYPQSYKRL